MRFILTLVLLFSSLKVFSGEVKILTLNVYRKPEIGADFFATERMTEICNVLKNEDHPHNKNWDIVLIQEAWTVGSRKILKNCGYKYTTDIGSGYWRVNHRRRHRRGGYRPRPGRHGRELNLGSGLLVLSKLPILKSLRYEFKNEGRLGNVFNDGEMVAQKSVYLTQIKLKTNEKIWVANTHLIANYCDNAVGPDCESYEDVRTKQMLEMKNVFEEYVGDDPLVFGGDLNAGEHPNAKDKSWLALPNIFPGFMQAPHDKINISTSSPTNFFKKGHKEGGKLDHIFASPHFLIENGHLAFEKTFKNKDGLDMNYSDHYGWESTINLK
ncbi:MAG: endonuclease/exonuclease/phosphatase family protein [Bacteriovoracaceae bacterium]|nr:endonuclease/exonuclease/phosphatase family protein [Bacteriovoracaceae bacterium]